MDLSIVIPAYDCGAALRRSVDSIACHTRANDTDVELVLVDDGSSDDTADVIELARKRLRHVKPVYRARDPLSCRARARNLGIQAATRELVLFLDAGVLPGPGLLERLASSPRSAQQVTICKVLGLFAEACSAAAESAHLIAGLAQLEQRADWQDVREPLLSAARDLGIELPAIWLLAWSAALAVPRRALLETGGFDETFTNWGAEDVDLAARLSARGLPFEWLNQAVAVHVPHARSAARRHEHAVNALRLHRKLESRESELFATWNDGIAVNLMARRLDQLDLGCVTPFVARSDVGHSTIGRCIVAGVNWSLVPPHAAVVLVHKPALVAPARARFARSRVECLLGLNLSFETDEFDHALLGDFVRLLPKDLQRSHLREMCRVARRVIVRLSTLTAHEAKYRTIAGWSWSSVEAVAQVGRESGLRVSSTPQSTRDAVELALTRA